ncbi:TetR/AcrR family transcriptional regulator [Actinomadura rudentiformis]|uniref:TetR/AcrR family transcriptional regulator n=1 Tax=Actinomadura rudentiformis TaxID=359158 RepID=A0A6H9YGW1_9ACTN|nr:TetR/AcrR family transcriptional regulator [Actinomadura rudentiformis]KAB2345515.1 TetR/AcrR family transcriptional regulator [Actinomadura rudentiformis]
MSQRESLLAAAKRCLAERGYARTSSRDIAAEAGANHAAINYHYGSKDALLIAALMETVEAWGDTVVPAGDTWKQTMESLPASRPMLVATLEAMAQAEHIPEVREHIAAAFERARPELAATIYGIDPEADDRTARAVASIHMALIAGLSQQWLVDPERALTADEVKHGLRALLERLEDA